MEKRTSFDVDPERYDRARPSYPDELFDALFERLEPTPEPKVLEVGPGTGLATRGLLDRGARVTAVEPGVGFVARLAETMPEVEVRHGDFETAELPLGSFDAVVCATAYHWIQGAARTERPHEVLRSGGWVAIIDLIQPDDPADRGYFERVQAIYASFDDHTHDWHAPTREQVRPTVADELAASSLYGPVEVITVDWDQTYTTAQYRELLLTYSGTLVRPPEERDALVDALTAVIDDEFDGTLTRPLVAALTLARSC